MLYIYIYNFFNRKEYKRAGGSTTNLHRHLKNTHSNKLNIIKENDIEQYFSDIPPVKIKIIFYLIFLLKVLIKKFI